MTLKLSVIYEGSIYYIKRRFFKTLQSCLMIFSVIFNNISVIIPRVTMLSTDLRIFVQFQIFMNNEFLSG